MTSFKVFTVNNLEDLIQKVIEHTNLSRAQIKKMIDEKKEELLFVNDIAAIHIIAKDLNVPLKKPELKKTPSLTIKRLKGMEAGISGLQLTAMVYRVYNPIEFTRKRRRTARSHGIAAAHIDRCAAPAG